MIIEEGYCLNGHHFQLETKRGIRKCLPAKIAKKNGHGYKRLKRSSGLTQNVHTVRMSNILSTQQRRKCLTFFHSLFFRLVTYLGSPG